MDIEKLRSRKPARTIAEIPPSVHDAISQGIVPTKNLVEWLSADRKKLFHAIGDVAGIETVKSSAELWTSKLRSESALKQSFAIGRWLAERCVVGDDCWRQLSTHESDIVREWSAIVVGLSPKMTFARKLAWMKPLADDDHSGLREIAWLALRADVANDPPKAIRSLVPWTGSRRERLRRFASELTRPCGVWTTHISLLKEQPELGLPLLEPLSNDDSKYVQDSVGNWLNDAGKSQPEWVRETIQRWRAKHDCPSTNAIIKRAIRNL